MKEASIVEILLESGHPRPVPVPGPSAMADATQLSPELARNVLSLARSLAAAARTRAMYPPEHPAVTAGLERLRNSVAQATAAGSLTIGVTPETLLVEGVRASRDPEALAEAAAFLHGRDILEMTFSGLPPVETLEALMALLATEPEGLRAAGGPATAWARQSHPAIAVKQVDYEKVLEDREVRRSPATKDDLWRSIVLDITNRRKSLDEATQQRLLEIAGDVGAIGELATEVMAPARTPDGSPMLTTQAAAVLAAYRHLTGIVSVLAPERREEVMGNIIEATRRIEPKVVVQMLGSGTGSGDEDGVVEGIIGGFDDVKVAELLATTLAIDGQASTRLAEVFDTIAPDGERKDRILRMTRTMLSETDFGQHTQFETLWSSMEELLLTYNERPFVSDSYRSALDGAGERAATMAAVELPPETGEWVETLGQENVRRLSVTLLIDLLNLERDAERAPQLAEDVASLAEDLLMGGEYALAKRVVEALASRAADRQAVISSPSRVALDHLAASVALREAAELLEEMNDEDATAVADICGNIGPAAVTALVPELSLESDTPGRRRAFRIALGFGAQAVGRLAALLSSGHWYAQRNAALLLGQIAAPEGVPLLQPLLRGHDPRVAREAVRALSNIDDPSAARAVHTVLRATSGYLRQAVVEALISERDPRVVPVLVRILAESQPLGADHAVVLDTLGALGTLGPLCDGPAVDDIVKLMRVRRWFGGRKLRAIKRASLQALGQIGSDAARSAIADAAATGDRTLRRLARARAT